MSQRSDSYINLQLLFSRFPLLNFQLRISISCELISTIWNYLIYSIYSHEEYLILSSIREWDKLFSKEIKNLPLITSIYFLPRSRSNRRYYIHTTYKRWSKGGTWNERQKIEVRVSGWSALVHRSERGRWWNNEGGIELRRRRDKSRNNLGEGRSKSKVCYWLACEGRWRGGGKRGGGR